MIISYDNLITRLWLSGAIMPFEKGGYAALNDETMDGAGTAGIAADADAKQTSTVWITRNASRQQRPHYLLQAEPIELHTSNPLQPTY